MSQVDAVIYFCGGGGECMAIVYLTDEAYLVAGKTYLHQ